jgi:hypothetical protein
LEEEFISVFFRGTRGAGQSEIERGSMDLVLDAHAASGQPAAEFNAFETGNASEAAKAVLTVRIRFSAFLDRS